MTPVEAYASIILHPGCTHLSRSHNWEICPAQKFFLRIARKHQHKLNSAGLAIGVWVNKRKIEAALVAAELEGDYARGQRDALRWILEDAK